MVRIRGRKPSRIIAMSGNNPIARTVSPSRDELEEELLNGGEEIASREGAEGNGDGGADVGSGGTGDGGVNGDGDNSAGGGNNSGGGDAHDGDGGPTNPTAGGDAGDGTVNPAEVTVVAAGSRKPTIVVVDNSVDKDVSDDVNNSKDSGNGSEAMECNDDADDTIAGLFAGISLIEEEVRVNFPITARPPLLTDASMVSLWYCYMTGLSYVIILM